MFSRFAPGKENLFGENGCHIVCVLGDQSDFYEEYFMDTVAIDTFF